MSVIGKLAVQALVATGLALPALGAGEERTTPDDLGVWLFLGFCALIVAAQVIPMIRAAGKKGDAPITTQATEEKQGH